ncbi:hypothetical protein GCM10011515_22080 [Tsuneonella deserti]|uniref:Uncharacterized protein n=1 Tax=Tsuneonella deserti TaxID=2035528 RepID=A0ABQ1SBW6_9SPHN|nr:hypothetical protein [Tsuneonella deserti]GGE01995.1 hypothetical protein GCM10011515_22080 [Tsuneonella deserti]
MTDTKGKPAPAWVARFLEALRSGEGVREASRIAGVTSSTPYNRRDKHEDFREAWDAIQPVDARRKRRQGPAPQRDATRVERFLDELAATSNVAAAAAVADLPVSRIYRLRRTDPDFARRWYAALAEGYDNLEMELLRHLRSASAGGESAGSAETGKAKFDTAAALRCLTAHRESVAREKGRRTLADEAATIAAINAKIDAMRARAKESDAAIRAARRAIADRVIADKPVSDKVVANKAGAPGGGTDG